jgi:hypothetical protein
LLEDAASGVVEQVDVLEDGKSLFGSLTSGCKGSLDEGSPTVQERRFKGSPESLAIIGKLPLQMDGSVDADENRWTNHDIRRCVKLHDDIIVQKGV